MSRRTRLQQTERMVALSVALVRAEQRIAELEHRLCTTEVALRQLRQHVLDCTVGANWSPSYTIVAGGSCDAV